jgi:hypothetical protein
MSGGPVAPPDRMSNAVPPDQCSDGRALLKSPKQPQKMFGDMELKRVIGIFTPPGSGGEAIAAMHHRFPRSGRRRALGRGGGRAGGLANRLSSLRP